MEVRTLTEYAKAGENDKLLDQDGINREIYKLYSLKLTGPSLQKVAHQLGDLQRATYQHGRGSAPPSQQLVPAAPTFGSSTGAFVWICWAGYTESFAEDEPDAVDLRALTLDERFSGSLS
ncbi:hypothetical protein LTR85_002468 [Meristemomyces frigidus]|nr:hypothetical protein LTR85_002468 [Meristemomyces frigidus]